VSKSLEYKLTGAPRQKDWRIAKAIHNIQASQAKELQWISTVMKVFFLNDGFSAKWPCLSVILVLQIPI